MIKFLAYRSFNRFDGFMLSGTAVLVHNSEWLAAGCILVGGSILSLMLEAAARSKPD